MTSASPSMVSDSLASQEREDGSAGGVATSAAEGFNATSSSTTLRRRVTSARSSVMASGGVAVGVAVGAPGVGSVLGSLAEGGGAGFGAVRGLGRSAALFGTSLEGTSARLPFRRTISVHPSCSPTIVTSSLPRRIVRGSASAVVRGSVWAVRGSVWAAPTRAHASRAARTTAKPAQRAPTEESRGDWI